MPEVYRLVELETGGAVVIGRILAMHIEQEMMLDAERHNLWTRRGSG